MKLDQILWAPPAGLNIIISGNYSDLRSYCEQWHSCWLVRVQKGLRSLREPENASDYRKSEISIFLGIKDQRSLTFGRPSCTESVCLICSSTFSLKSIDNLILSNIAVLNCIQNVNNLPPLLFFLFHFLFLLKNIIIIKTSFPRHRDDRESGIHQMCLNLLFRYRAMNSMWFTNLFLLLDGSGLLSPPSPSPFSPLPTLVRVAARTIAAVTLLFPSSRRLASVTCNVISHIWALFEIFSIKKLAKHPLASSVSVKFHSAMKHISNQNLQRAIRYGSYLPDRWASWVGCIDWQNRAMPLKLNSEFFLKPFRTHWNLRPDSEKKCIQT